MKIEFKYGSKTILEMQNINSPLPKKGEVVKIEGIINNIGDDYYLVEDLEYLYPSGNVKIDLVNFNAPGGMYSE